MELDLATDLGALANLVPLLDLARLEESVQGDLGGANVIVADHVVVIDLDLESIVGLGIKFEALAKLDVAGLVLVGLRLVLLTTEQGVANADNNIGVVLAENAVLALEVPGTENVDSDTVRHVVCKSVGVSECECVDVGCVGLCRKKGVRKVAVHVGYILVPCRYPLTKACPQTGNSAKWITRPSAMMTVLAFYWCPFSFPGPNFLHIQSVGFLWA